MVTREVESQIRAVFRTALNDACNQLSEQAVVDVWWPDGFAERMAEIATQTVALMAESGDMAVDV